MLCNLRVGLIAWCVAIMGVFAPAAAAQDATPVASTGSSSAEWLRFDVDLTLFEDGILHVTETQEVAFHGGPFTSGYASIPVRNIEWIRNLGVGEQVDGGEIHPYEQVNSDTTTTNPNTYRVQVDSEFVNVDWWYPPTTDGQRTFVLQYDVRGALRSSTEDGVPYGEIWWIAIDSEVTESAPVRSATVTIRLPAAVDAGEVLVSPDGYVPSTIDDGSVWTWTRADLSPGYQFIVRLRFPLDVLPAPDATPSAEYRETRGLG
jgi:hypothetical protein